LGRRSVFEYAFEFVACLEVDALVDDVADATEEDKHRVRVRHVRASAEARCTTSMSMKLPED
jgi:hypothetical protein